MALFTSAAHRKDRLSGGGTSHYLRVCRAGGDYLGLVEINLSTTLSQLRKEISKNLDIDLVPSQYRFVKRNGEYVSLKHESSVLASTFLPCVNLASAGDLSLPIHLRVTHWSGAVFKMWVLPATTFAQLREEASRFWQLSPSDTVLEDAEGVVWSDTALVHQALAFEQSPPALSAPLRPAPPLSGPLHASPSLSGPPTPLLPSEGLGEGEKGAAQAHRIILRLRDKEQERRFVGRTFKSFSAKKPHSSPTENGKGQLQYVLEGMNGWGRRGAGSMPEEDDSLSGMEERSSLDFASSCSESEEDTATDTLAPQPAMQQTPPSQELLAVSRATPGMTFRLDDRTVMVMPKKMHAVVSPPTATQRAANSHLEHIIDATVAVVPDALLEFTALEPHLWRIFTYYSVSGDAVDPFHMRGRQWRCFLDDCGLLEDSSPASQSNDGSSGRTLGQQRKADTHDRSITPQVAELIYAAALAEGRRHVNAALLSSMPESKMSLADASQAKASVMQAKLSLVTNAAVGMDYLQFLRALIAIATRAHRRRSPEQHRKPMANPLASATTLPQLPVGYTPCVDRHRGAVEAAYLLVCNMQPVIDGAEACAESEIPTLTQFKLDARSPVAPGLMHSMLPQLVTANDAVAFAFMDALREDILPHASAWQPTSWLEESMLIHHSSDTAHNEGLHTESEHAASLIAVLQPFVPALQLLFAYYAYAALDDPATKDPATTRKRLSSAAQEVAALREKETAQRRSRYAGGTSSTLVISDAAPTRGRALTKARSNLRTDMQMLGVSPNSVVAEILAKVRPPRVDTGSVVGARTPSRLRSRSGSASKFSAGYATSMLSKLARLKSDPPSMGSAEMLPSTQLGDLHDAASAKLNSLIPSSNTAMRFAGFMRFIMDCGLCVAGEFIIPSRSAAEAFIAAAGSANMSPDAVDNGHDESRVVLDFHRFLDCLCRMALRLQHSKGLCMPPPHTKLKAMLQAMSDKLERSSAVDIFESRKEHTTANPDYLLRGVISFQSAFKRLTAEEGTNYILLTECLQPPTRSTANKQAIVSAPRRNAVYPYRRARAKSAGTARRADPPIFASDMARLRVQLNADTRREDNSAEVAGDEEHRLLEELQQLDSLWYDQRRLSNVQKRLLTTEQASAGSKNETTKFGPSYVTVKLRSDARRLGEVVEEREAIARRQQMWQQILLAREMTAAAVQAATERQQQKQSPAPKDSDSSVHEVSLSRGGDEDIAHSLRATSPRAPAISISVTSPLPNSRMSLHSAPAVHGGSKPDASGSKRFFSPGSVGHRKASQSLSFAPSINKLLTSEGFDIPQVSKAPTDLISPGSHVKTPTTAVAAVDAPGGIRSAAAGVRAGLRYLENVQEVSETGSELNTDRQEEPVQSPTKQAHGVQDQVAPMLVPGAKNMPSPNSTRIARLSASTAVSACQETAAAKDAETKAHRSPVPTLPLSQVHMVPGTSALSARSDLASHSPHLNAGHPLTSGRQMMRAATGLARSTISPEKVHFTSRLSAASLERPATSRGKPHGPEHEVGASNAASRSMSPAEQREHHTTAHDEMTARSHSFRDANAGTTQDDETRNGEETEDDMDSVSQTGPSHQVRQSLAAVATQAAQVALTRSQSPESAHPRKDAPQQPRSPGEFEVSLSPSRLSSSEHDIQKQRSEDFVVSRNNSSGLDNMAGTSSEASKEVGTSRQAPKEANASKSRDTAARPDKPANITDTKTPTTAATADAAATSRPTTASAETARKPEIVSPKAGAPSARDRLIIERRLLYKRLLLDGSNFRKFGRRGFPHVRRVFLSSDLRYLHWCAPGSRPDDHEAIPVADILQINEAPITAVFQKNVGWYKHPELCFSVVSSTRSLDVEASSAAEKEEWITALLCLKKYRSTI